MQRQQPTDRVEIVTAAQREEKIKNLLACVSRWVIPYFEAWVGPASNSPLNQKLDALDAALEAYRNRVWPWDSKLIDVVGQIDGVKFKTQEFSCNDSVMDLARDIFVFINSPKEEW